MIRLVLVGIIATVILPVSAQSPTLRYMPFGDSITDHGCWRAWIWQKFQQDGYAVDFVGSVKSRTVCNNLDYDKDHEGHPGYRAINIVSQNQLVGWLKQNPADIVTMHLGTNDIFLGTTRHPTLSRPSASW
jgi:GDSL-like Lipase/Acylhydrolase family